MTVYFYQATDKKGKYIEGSVDAPDSRLAVRKIRNLNYLPIKVSEEKTIGLLSRNLNFLSFNFLPKISSKALLAATQQLSILVSSGTDFRQKFGYICKNIRRQCNKKYLIGNQKQGPGRLDSG